MQTIPLSAIPSQELRVLLANQNTRLKVYQKTTGMYVDLYVNDQPIIVGVAARDRSLIVRHAYLGFTGDLSFFDTQGVSDPEYDALGTRYQLVYLEAADLA